MNCYLNVISIKKCFFSGHIEKIHITGYKGGLNLYPGHSPLLTMIKPGLLIIFTILKKKYLYVSNGILEVQPNAIYILPDEACFLHDLNYNQLIKEKNHIKKKILKLNNLNNFSLKNKLLNISIKIKLFKKNILNKKKY